jgi:hypothetical protein
MNMDSGRLWCCQTVILRQQSTKKARERLAKRLCETIHAAIADTQSDVDAATVHKNPPQLRAVSSEIQM